MDQHCRTNFSILAFVKSHPFIIVFLSIVLFIVIQEREGVHPDHFYDTPDFLLKYGYPVETHYITTDDGVVAVVHRIPHGKNQTRNFERPVVYLQHGLGCSSETWVLRGPEHDLGFILADSGFDVWLGNARGSHHSNLQHLKSDKSEAALFFSIHEGGYYDLPAVIDYILETTGQKQLSYVGHSMGSTMFFIMCSTRPEYNQKIRSMAALAPVSFLEGLQTYTLSITVPFILLLQQALRPFELNRLNTRGILRSHVFKILCNNNSPLFFLCITILEGIQGTSYEPRNNTFTSVYLSHVPATLDPNFMRHFVQTSETGKFQNFDFGEEENKRRYNRSSPPEYDLSPITVPIALYSGREDILSTEKSVTYLRERLPNIVLYTFYETFNHFDIVWGTHAAELVFKPVQRFLYDRLTKKEKEFINSAT